MAGLSGEQDLEAYVMKGDIKVVERFFEVPLDYSNLDGEKIRIFARNLIPGKKAEKVESLPYLVYLQGGPGFEVPLSFALKLCQEFHEREYQTLWLDQRGTGLSTPICAEVLKGKSDEEMADYFRHFRADNIVRDCEHIRTALLGDRPNAEDRRWTILGQSFGGFCALTYLSYYPNGLKEVFLTGGLAPISRRDPDDIYCRLIERVVKRNKVYYEKYPQDVQRVWDILKYLELSQTHLPNGGTLSPDLWLSLGIKFGFSTGIDLVHEIVLRATNDLQTYDCLSSKLLQTVQASIPFGGNPIYAVLHEACYCQGRPSRWSAWRALTQDARFSYLREKHQTASQPVYFYGEMILPNMFEDCSGLRQFKGVVDILSEYDDWSMLYDEAQLAKNEVKVTAATYIDDMYVDYDLAQETASRIRGTEQFITNQLFHDGLTGQNSKEVITKLFEISRRVYD